MKFDTQLLMRLIICIVVAGAALFLLELWFDVFNDATFIKLMVTLFVVGMVAAFVMAAKRDLTQEKKLRDDKYLD